MDKDTQSVCKFEYKVTTLARPQRDGWPCLSGRDLTLAWKHTGRLHSRRPVEDLETDQIDGSRVDAHSGRVTRNGDHPSKYYPQEYYFVFKWDCQVE